jgi:acetyltransferase-like isoleucine patch superfamily enzyme
MRVQVASTSVVRDGVRFKGDALVEDFCVIGALSSNAGADFSKTIIGDNVVIRSHVVIYAGNHIGNQVHIGNKANIRESNQIGDRVSIGALSVVEHHVLIEDEVRIHSQVFVPEYSVLKKGAWLGPNVVLTNAKYPKSPGAKAGLRGVVIEEGAKIGANATILPGVVIGRNALVGAGAVVTQNVPPNTVVVGNPARIINQIENLPYRGEA